MTEANQRSAADTEAEQEAILAKRYGGMQPKKRLIPKDQKFFDSADWQLQKQGVKPRDAPPATPARALAPKLAPKPEAAAGSKGRRRASHLGDLDDEH